MTLCWGGPYHGEVVEIPGIEFREVYLFPVKTRVSWKNSLEPSTLPLQKVQYRVRQIYAPFQVYHVLIYDEKFDRLLKNLLMTMNALCRMVKAGFPLIFKVVYDETLDEGEYYFKEGNNQNLL